MLLSSATRKVARKTETRTSHVLAPVFSGSSTAVAGLNVSFLAVVPVSCDALPAEAYVASESALGGSLADAVGSNWAILGGWCSFVSPNLYFSPFLSTSRLILLKLEAGIE